MFFHSSAVRWQQQFPHLTILGISRSRMQQLIAGSTRARSGLGLCPCESCNLLLHPALTSAQDGLDPLQLVVVFFLVSSREKTYLDLQCVLPATCTGGVFLVITSTFTWLATMLPPSLQLALVAFFSTNQAFTNVHPYVQMSMFCNFHCVVVVVCGSVLPYVAKFLWISRMGRICENFYREHFYSNTM